MTADLHADIRVRRDDDFSLDVRLHAPAGATTVVVGPNGAGKSTLLAALAGLVPLRGIVTLGPRLLDDAETGFATRPDERGMGIVFQDGLLFDHLDVTANVAFGPRARGADREAAARIAARWLDRVGAADLADRRPTQLSGGERQRVALARALATEPDVLLLDEPLAAVDVAGRAELRHVLIDVLADITGPRVVVTHDPTEAFLLGDHLHVVEAGRTTQTGTADELRLRPATPWIADLVGTNLLAGEAHDGVLIVDGHHLVIADPHLTGPALATISPHAIALHRSRPSGSPRNAWATTVERVEPAGARARVLLGAPLRLTAEVTAAAVAALDLVPRAPVHASLKATEIGLVPDA